ncbi:ribonuclease Z [Candidatus Woesearchaeota archaeon]|nr:ribonuclease Z [Candidatus Woesearchaeota archaeon]
MELTILGTSSMVPTKERNVSGYFLALEDEGILLDCGEGTQRQMNIANIKRTRITKVLLSHWHGDHVSGLIGLLQTIGNEEPQKKISIYGPQGTKKNMKHLLQSCLFENKIHLEIVECKINKPKIIFETKGYTIEAAPMTHSVPCIGYAIKIKDVLRIDIEKAKKLRIPEGPWMKLLSDGKPAKIGQTTVLPEQVTQLKKGKKMVYIPDTTPNKESIMLAEDADLLLIESTYDADLREKAEQYMHMTSRDCATIAQQARVQKLILTHFSQRYKDIKKIEEDAKQIFPNTFCAYDFMRMTI